MWALLLGASATRTDIVLARYEEDISWVQPFLTEANVIIYNKGSPLNGTIELPNVGRESHTYLHHIVHNYDDLAYWTVFSQAGEPSFGYAGHLSRGVRFQDYLNEQVSTFWINTVAVTKTGEWEFCQTFRRSFAERARAELDDRMRCPEERFGSCNNMGGFNNFLRNKCTTQGLDLEHYWTGYLEEASNLTTLYFPQGARFAVSRDKIRQRPMLFYLRLMELLAQDVDPCAGYLLEWTWPLVFRARPCIDAARRRR